MPGNADDFPMGRLKRRTVSYISVEGKISIDRDRLNVEFSEEQQARARGTFAGLREHTTEIQGFGAICAPKIMVNKEMLAEKMDRIKNFDKRIN